MKRKEEKILTYLETGEYVNVGVPGNLNPGKWSNPLEGGARQCRVGVLRPPMHTSEKRNADPVLRETCVQKTYAMIQHS